MPAYLLMVHESEPNMEVEVFLERIMRGARLLAPTWANRAILHFRLLICSPMTKALLLCIIKYYYSTVEGFRRQMILDFEENVVLCTLTGVFKTPYFGMLG